MPERCIFVFLGVWGHTEYSNHTSYCGGCPHQKDQQCESGWEPHHIILDNLETDQLSQLFNWSCLCRGSLIKTVNTEPWGVPSAGDTPCILLHIHKRKETWPGSMVDKNRSLVLGSASGSDYAILPLDNFNFYYTDGYNRFQGALSVLLHELSKLGAVLGSTQICNWYQK